MRVAVLGAGSGGLSATTELSLNGHEVRLWNRSPEALAPLRVDGHIHYNGVFGEGSCKLAVISTAIDEVLRDADAILVCLPTVAHRSVAELLLAVNRFDIPVVLNPGHTGGALEFSEVFLMAGVTPPPLAEFSTLTYVARKPDPGTVSITGSAKRVWVAPLQGGEPAVQIAQQLYPAATRAPDVIATGLANVNMVLHLPGAILGAAWVESTGGNFTFYVEGLPPGVGRVMQALDNERVAVAAAYGHDLVPLFAEMQAIGTIEPSAKPEAGLAAAVRGGTANQTIRAPDSFAHRYYIEDFCYGLQPFLSLAEIARQPAPVARSLMTLAYALLGDRVPPGRTAKSMGIENLTKQQLMEKVTA